MKAFIQDDTFLCIISAGIEMPSRHCFDL